MKTIAITGASGFVGQYITKVFTEQGYVVVPILRADIHDLNKLQTKLEQSDVLINLAGANIIGRWSASYKKVLYDSRIETTNALVKGMKLIDNPPKLFISTSAVGIYKNDKLYDEYSTNYADNFLGNLVDDWEDEANKVKELGVRVAILRFGIVLGKEGGALQKMLTPFKLGVGGIIGDGKQAFSFIHIDDLARFYLHLIDNQALEGVYNMTTTKPTTNYGLTKALGKVLKRPTFLPLPTFVLQLIYGEGATVLTDGQSVIPKRVLESGFKFKFEEIDEVLEDLLK
ncbi:MAG: Cell division inhibitor [uncultured Sulfurovum sp.]|uniref:Cell division inhibitor n=1 Tax=uncultured Sulfurovum sp. TaxID=269237 RepID=A0A6S6RWM0_9BACT|nr:MAG: Cell division inhibitor [uncultured Sulfurovum sp.]